ncbi:helix-turn-helix domain-containing protein [Paenibacillus endoradicis]|uniref:helix-turn-helix domain-containing protein n=1 Tax=Paenibacillus endoradicis TaxID=2972487 RepID=UPI00215933D9|nr:helix-turn-helix domain-containing protein [Paenibacillus endoradicis]MCR8657105.1 response regulator [Paenibacillus endoradicis]
MLRVLLADDEPIVRLALREMIDWNYYGCEIVGEAANGRDALTIMKDRKIDLAIVDIQMPVITGIELVKQIKELELTEEFGIVMLSAFSNFNYVREAFLYGALDYIIKEDMSPDTIGAMLTRVVEPLYERKSERKRQEAESIDRIEQRKEKSLWEMVEGNESEDAILEFTQLEGQRIFLLQILVDHDGINKNHLLDERTSRFVMRAFLQVFSLQNVYCVVSERGKGAYVSVVAFPTSIGDQAIHSQLIDLLTRATQQVKEYVNISLSIGVSSPCSRITDWAKRYEEASRQAELRFFNGQGRVFIAQGGQENLIESIKPNWTSLLQFIANYDDRWESEAIRLFNVLKRSHHGRYEDWMRPYRALIRELESLLYSKGISLENMSLYQSTEFSGSLIGELEHFIYIERLHEWLLKIMRAFVEQLDPLKQLVDSAPRMTERVKVWIDKHYGESISLTVASEMVGVSESYLSKVFAKEIGETFIEYVTRKRIDSAIQLLQTGMKLYEISERVGYPNQGYFSKMFKKVTGRSPNEYREHLSSN